MRYYIDIKRKGGRTTRNTNLFQKIIYRNRGRIQWDVNSKIKKTLFEIIVSDRYQMNKGGNNPMDGVF